ncbi:hypothetical protein GUITHDRAFT_131660 [Guillardia theta CCMP2712]|uniref:Uncharacterized protein n=1 Tax=Guillardia theta (strain CCMP2712) TaxID=905079 RepID=L1K3S5_GUITC|nr:hypothetical protein GUITHDRAFT_131660 [Guillardia theta CCMP2712]EKX55466.1 hypothetical protein GUITHDRAFT_131660 [Guillardia theta CCMP2712]|eukprot:XP_005842446.1 hypothetical protein GUITHDRAFT_131660 [Guillardia theta CCMP2712]
MVRRSAIGLMLQGTQIEHKMDKDDVRRQVDGVEVTAETIHPLLLGNDEPGSKVLLRLRKMATDETIEVVVQRFEIAKHEEQKKAIECWNNLEESNQSKISTLDRLVQSHQEQAREYVLQSMSCLRDVISIGEEKEDEYTSLIQQLEITCTKKDQETQRIEKAVADLNSQLLTLRDELISQTTQRDKTRAEYLKAKDRLSYEKEKRALAEDKYRETNHQLRSEKEVQRILLHSFDTFYSIFENQAQEINLLLVSCQSLIQEYKASKDIPFNPPPLNQVMQGFALDTSKLNMTGLNDLLKNFSQTTLSLTPQKMDNKAKFVPVKANSIKLQQYDPKEAVFGKKKIVLEAVVADQTSKNRVPELLGLSLEMLCSK